MKSLWGIKMTVKDHWESKKDGWNVSFFSTVNKLGMPERIVE